jgi:glycosyltransferase involved in cell wall biosynthesis
MAESGMNEPCLQVHQFHHSVSQADAVTNHLFFIQECLREIGVGGDIFAAETHQLEGNRVHPWTPDTFIDGDLLLIHHSQGNPWLREVLTAEVPKAVVYHNITPPRFFAHDPYLADLCRMGRRQLPLLRDSVLMGFAVSDYNAAELRAAGFSKVDRLPLHDLETAEVSAAFRRPGRTLDLLFVGKLTPHKNQALLIQTLYFLKAILQTPLRLTLVGREDRIYGEYLRLLTRALGLQKEVRFTGPVSAAQLGKYYRSANAFLCPSQHEGFCVPLVEAMLHRVPVFALPQPGVKETLRGAGVECRTQKPHELAEIIAGVLEDPHAIKAILVGQQRRLRALGQTQKAARVQSALMDILQTLKKPQTVARHVRRRA